MKYRAIAISVPDAGTDILLRTHVEEAYLSKLIIIARSINRAVAPCAISRAARERQIPEACGACIDAARNRQKNKPLGLASGVAPRETASTVPTMCAC